MTELDTDQKSALEECIPCQELLARIDADLLELEDVMAAERSKRLRTIALVVVLVVVAVGGIVTWRMFA